MTFKLISPPATIEVDSKLAIEGDVAAKVKSESTKEDVPENVVKATMNTLPRGEVLKIIAVMKKQFAKLDDGFGLDLLFGDNEFFTAPNGYVCNLLNKLLVSWDIEQDGAPYIVDKENVESFCANYPDHAGNLVINYMIAMEGIYAKN